MLRRLFARDAGSPPASIYEHIKAHVRRNGPGLDEAGESLPDETDLRGPIRFAPGAMDGIAVAHGSAEANQRELERILRLILDATRQPERPGVVSEFDRQLKDLDFLAIVDSLLERIRLAGADASAIELLGRRLATESGKRNGVKLGISLLGMVSGADNSEILLTIGRHEEFTLYSAVALAGTSADPERALWDLARLVDGWGRIQAVERLRDTRRPEIRAWILREGFHNTVMDEYLAYIAATTGGLLGELEKERVDDELLTAACDIIAALITNGPAESIDDYDDAPRAIDLLLGHLSRRPCELRQFQAIDVIEEFLANRQPPASHFFSPLELAEMHAESLRAWGRRLERGWTPELRERLAQVAQEIKMRPEWREIAERGLKSSDDEEFYRAVELARALGIDVLDAHLARIRDRPHDPNWFAIMQAVDERRIDEVLTLAERSIRLDEIATGPGKELGLGPEFAQHSHLDFVVQDLRRFPGRGWPLVAAALHSPVIRNRNLAISALDAWPRDHWPDEALDALMRAEATEPDEELRSGMQALLRGERLPEPKFDVADIEAPDGPLG